MEPLLGNVRVIQLTAIHFLQITLQYDIIPYTSQIEGHKPEYELMVALQLYTKTYETYENVLKRMKMHGNA